MCVGTTGLVVLIDGKLAEVDFGGVTAKVRVDFLPDAVPGDRVLVHAGFAISRVSAKEAEETARAWAELKDAFAGGRK